ncbi:MAG TPA: sugar phosphate isomerase/epimerase [Terriglobia bacterium]|nr:sugar phosphate isomerase/epimerase [Terriglobia bacterium]
MLKRRNFLASVLGGVAAGVGMGVRDLWAAGGPAWPGPIGLELYTVRDQFAKDPAGTLQKVAAVGYKEVESGPSMSAAKMLPMLRANGLALPSTYVDAPKTLEDWKKMVALGKSYGVHYIVVGDNPRLSTDAWKRRADLFNQCGTLSLAAGMQFCYHAHFNEFARADNTCGYDIMLTQCDPKLLKMEMDVFWGVYAGIDPVDYFQRYPGRFPLLHIKDLYKDVAVNPHESPADDGPNPFAPVGQGKIDWRRIFAHAGEAGAKHIFVEQDRCNMPSLEAMKISYDYLKTLHLS